MSEHEFETRLRSALRAEVETAGLVPSELWSGVLDIPTAYPVRGVSASNRRFLILAMAAMLTAFLVGGAVAIGSGLIKVPWLPDDRGDTDAPFTALSPGMLGPNTFCEQSLPDDLVLWIGVEAGEFGPEEYFLTDDGLLLRQVTSGFGPGNETWSQRRVRPGAAERLVSQIAESGLRDCKVVTVAGPEIGIIARTASGVVEFAIAELGYRVPTERETEAGAVLAAQLGGPDLGLAPDDFLDDDWMSYILDRWEVLTNRWEGRPVTAEGYLVEGIERPGWADMVLGGSAITAFGEPLGLHPSEAAFLDERRCAVVGSADAQDLRAMLTATLGEPPIPESPDTWTFHDVTGGMSVYIGALAPHQAGCHYGPEPGEPRENLIEGLDPCAFMPSSWGATLEQPRSDPIPQDSSVPTTDFGGGWASCENFMHGWMYVSRHPISAEAARAVVGSQFGQGVQTESMSGATVYLNGCYVGMEPACADAVAISAEPYLVIVAPDGPGSADRLRMLATEVIGRIQALD